MLLRRGVSWLIAGLGNPDLKYVGTRHNAGYAALDALAGELGAENWKRKFQSQSAQAVLGGEQVLLLKPTTYMNLSGNAIAEAARFYHLDPSHIIIMCDDISLPVGRIRVRASGSAGGHNGLKSIIERLGTQDFPRIKIGVGAKPHPDFDLAAWVLATFPPQERETMAGSYRNAAAAAMELVRSGPVQAANRFNGK